MEAELIHIWAATGSREMRQWLERHWSCLSCWFLRDGSHGNHMDSDGRQEGGTPHAQGECAEGKSYGPADARAGEAWRFFSRLFLDQTRGGHYLLVRGEGGAGSSMYLSHVHVRK